MANPWPDLGMSVRHYQVTGLPGLAPGPMGNWLACIGLLRAASRLDPSARLRWLDGGMPVLTADTDVIGAIAASEDFRHTPVITPWQAGGGWGEKDKTPRDRIALLAAGPSPRLSAYRPAIEIAHRVLRAHPAAAKDDIVRLLRNELPDDALPWLDAAVPLRSSPGDGTLAAWWAPIAGTGGNDGRWDLSTNCHAALLDLERAPRGKQTAADPAARRARLLADLINGTEDEPLLDISAGPYWPGADGLLNPWAMVLLAEGLCAWGDSGHLHPFASPGQPWTSAAGPEISGEENRGEAWLPMWDAPMSIGDVRLILATRPRWSGRPAGTATAMYSSMHALGWPRGVTGFLRYGLVQRKGRAYEAVLLDGALSGPPPEEMLSTAEAAARAGIAAKTWSAYVARGQAPGPDERDPRTGRPLWMAATVETWLETRPGQGARTDRPKTADGAGNGETGETS